MAFTLRAVVREASGKVGLVIARWPLQAPSPDAARREVDRGRWETGGVEPNSYEIVDERGTAVTWRSYKKGHMSAPWRAHDPYAGAGLSAAE
jgi:hypothetical protein